ncbi:hypothetical protein [Paraburkholderia sp.]|uniref:hypothetical protein n=1 Tax=Paraburkholderia sp. TaxID=1926495 RepID=UPI002F41E46E
MIARTKNHGETRLSFLHGGRKRAVSIRCVEQPVREYGFTHGSGTSGSAKLLQYDQRLPQAASGLPATESQQTLLAQAAQYRAHRSRIARQRQGALGGPMFGQKRANTVTNQFPILVSRLTDFIGRYG